MFHVEPAMIELQLIRSLGLQPAPTPDHPAWEVEPIRNDI